MTLDKVLRALKDVEEHLELLPASPLLREMRARFHAYEAVVNVWRYRPPTDVQLRTMSDLVTELTERVRFRRPSITRPPPPPAPPRDPAALRRSAVVSPNEKPTVVPPSTPVRNVGRIRRA